MINLNAYPYFKIAVCAFILNTIWEFAQCTILYNMWDWTFIKATVWMWAAIIGDVLIVLALVKLTELVFSRSFFQQFQRKMLFGLIAFSFLASVFLEWIAVYLELWTYSELMPSVRILDIHIGLSPITQITLLPAISLVMAIVWLQLSYFKCNRIN